MSREGVRILLALYSRLKPPPSEAERIELLEFFRKEGEDGRLGCLVGKKDEANLE